jgi:hypothetical protein
MTVPSFSQLLLSLERNLPMASEAIARGNIKMLKSFLGPAYRGFLLQSFKGADSSTMTANHRVMYDWNYLRQYPAMSNLYEAAKSGQWTADDGTIDWNQDFDPLSTETPIVPDFYCPGSILPIWAKLSDKERAIQRRAMLSWILSQILHGEQGALYGAAQTLQAVPWL